MDELIIKLLIHYLEITAPLLFWPGLVYLLMLFYSYRVLKTKFLKATSKKETEWPKVTVIVVTRNEAENLPNLLKALAGQTYQGRIESLIVDDGSTDGTAAIVAEYKPAEVFLKRYPAPPAGMSPKKWAITNAVQEANGDIIITTDADCVPTNQWLESMVAGLLADKSKKMVLGPVVLESSGTLLDNLQAQQFGAVMAVSFAFAEKGYPFSGSAANLVYYKNDFLAVGGYSGNAQKSGGDDVFLIERFHLAFPDSVGICTDENALVTTSTQKTWESFARQSIRWASKTGSYKNKTGIFLALGILVFHFAFIAQLILAFLISAGAFFIADAQVLSAWLEGIYGNDPDIEPYTQHPINDFLIGLGFILSVWSTFLWMWILRTYAEGLLLKTWFNKFKHKGNPNNKIALNVIRYSFYVLVVGLFSMFKPKVNWKGRKTQ